MPLCLMRWTSSLWYHDKVHILKVRLFLRVGGNGATCRGGQSWLFRCCYNCQAWYRRRLGLQIFGAVRHFDIVGVGECLSCNLSNAL